MKDYPNIGVNRFLIKNIHVNSFEETEKEFNFINSPDDNYQPKLNSILVKNFNNINKYKNEGGIIVFDELLKEQTNSIIKFSNLLDILSIDENSFELFVDKNKGEWVEDHNITMDNIKNLNNDVNFESRFESGNLRMAIKINDNEYDLIIRNDINSGKTYQWFYFQVRLFLDKLKLSPNQELKFNIINLHKKDMLFSKGLRVLKYSEINKKWSRNTKDIFYFMNGISIEDKQFYTLTFSIDITDILKNHKFNSNYNIDNIYFSYCYPYTYSDLDNYIKKLLTFNNIEKILRIETIGRTLADNKIHMLVITNFDSSFEEISHRPAVILTSRVHPGESNSSFVIQGVIDSLLDQKNKISYELRKKFIFKIVPMLNPDGVINGNFRTSLIGQDLNRQWIDPRDNIAPCIFYTKEMIKKTAESREIFFFCDFHGHSNKNNFFIYGCPNIKKRDKIKIHQEIVISKIFQEKNDFYDPLSCTFKIVASKLKTARAVLKNEFNVDFSYCLESSIGSILQGENKNTFFIPENYLKIGTDFCSCLNEMTKEDLFNNILDKLQLEDTMKLETINSDKIKLSKLYNVENIIKIKKLSSENKKKQKKIKQEKLLTKNSVINIMKLEKPIKKKENYYVNVISKRNKNFKLIDSSVIDDISLINKNNESNKNVITNIKDSFR